MMPSTDFHPGLRKVARLAPRSLIGPRTLGVIRRLASVTPRGKDPDGVEALILRSGVGVRLHRPDGVSQPGAALLWIHGGGYVTGTDKQDERLCRRVALALGVTVGA